MSGPKLADQRNGRSVAMRIMWVGYNPSLGHHNTWNYTNELGEFPHDAALPDAARRVRVIVDPNVRRPFGYRPVRRPR
jgi:hypothetical protein